MASSSLRTVVLLFTVTIIACHASSSASPQVGSRWAATRIRGGSSRNPFQARTPPKVQRSPGQSKPSTTSTSTPFAVPKSDEGNQEVDAKTMIDSFLTRENRNSFIGR